MPGDRLVYTGNMIGRGSAVRETMDELLSFRRALIAMPGMLADDVVYLRGAQEEMWQKLLQLQFAPIPPWCCAGCCAGRRATLVAYGGDPDQGMACPATGRVDHPLDQQPARLHAGGTRSRKRDERSTSRCLHQRS